MVSVKVKEIAYDILMNPVVLLVDEDEAKALPIWIGPFEAHAIAIALQEIHLNRPLTHDLLKGICERLEAKLSMIIINDIKDGTYYAEIHMWHNNKELIFDSRPSDAIALAIRTATPIYMSKKVAACAISVQDLFNEERQGELKKILESSRPQDLKKHLH
jgi:hypothetical protein